MSTAGERVSVFRKKAGLKIKALAKQADIQYATLFRIEKGRQEPKADELEKIAAALGMTVAELYADDVPLEPAVAS